MTEPLLLLPGMMCDARLFGPQAEALERPIEIPVLSGADTMAGLARNILADAPPRFALGGLSMGGIVAMEILRQAPERVARIALMDTNPLAEADEVKRRRHGQMERANAGQLAEVMREDMKPNYLAQPGPRGQILDLCMEMALDLGPEVFLTQSCALRDRPDQTETLRRFTGPALVLCGEEDRLCPIERHELMHRLMPQSTLTIIKGAGHLPPLEQPKETTAALRRWLEETPNG